MRSKFMMFLILIILIAGCAVICAQKQEVAPMPVPMPKKDSDTVDVKAKYMKSAWGDKRVVILKGDVIITHEDTVLTSQVVDFNDETKVAVSPGKLRIKNPQCDINGDKGQMDLKKRVGVVEGNVVMLIIPKAKNNPVDKDSTKEKLNKPTTILCPKVEYKYGKKIMNATGGVKFTQQNREMTADYAVYDENKELLVLNGAVQGIDEDKQTFSAPGPVKISLKEGDEWMEAPNASASFKINLEEETETAKP